MITKCIRKPCFVARCHEIRAFFGEAFDASADPAAASVAKKARKQFNSDAKASIRGMFGKAQGNALKTSKPTKKDPREKALQWIYSLDNMLLQTLGRHLSHWQFLIDDTMDDAKLKELYGNPWKWPKLMLCLDQGAEQVAACAFLLAQESRCTLNLECA